MAVPMEFCTAQIVAYLRRTRLDLARQGTPNMSRRFLAAHLGVAERTVARWECGEADTVTLIMLAKWCEYLGLTMSFTRVGYSDLMINPKTMSPLVDATSPTQIHTYAEKITGDHKLVYLAHLIKVIEDERLNGTDPRKIGRLEAAHAKQVRRLEPDELARYHKIVEARYPFGVQAVREAEALEDEDVEYCDDLDYTDR